MSKTIAIRANAFGRIENLKVQIEDGVVRVYDSVAGYYTTCHSLSAAAIRRAKKLAEA